MAKDRCFDENGVFLKDLGVNCVNHWREIRLFGADFGHTREAELKKELILIPMKIEKSTLCCLIRLHSPPDGSIS